MSRTNSVEEILAFAISREVEAHRLYVYMAKRVENPEISKTCEEFAEEELEHKTKLELEIMKRGHVVSNFNLSNYTIDASKEINMDYEELLVFAIKKEETSINFYTDLAMAVINRASRETFLSLAEEETKHKEQFETEYQHLQKSK